MQSVEVPSYHSLTGGRVGFCLIGNQIGIGIHLHGGPFHITYSTSCPWCAADIWQRYGPARLGAWSLWRPWAILRRVAHKPPYSSQPCLPSERTRQVQFFWRYRSEAPLISWPLIPPNTSSRRACRRAWISWHWRGRWPRFALLAGQIYAARLCCG